MRKCMPPLVLIGAFTELQKSIFSFVMSVCIELFGSHYMYFHEISCLSIFRKSVERIQVLLQSDNNNGRFVWRPIYIFRSYLVHFLLEGNMFRTNALEKIKTGFLSVTFFSENLVIYEIMWKNIESRAVHRWQNGSCTLHAGYLRLHTDTIISRNSHCFSTSTMVARPCLSVTL
jgi:hypothetical protein